MTRRSARITGAVYFSYFVVTIAAASLIGRVPAALGDAANLFANALYAVVSVLLYRLLKPVNANIALLALGISVIGCIVQSPSPFHLRAATSSLPIFGLFNLTIGYLIVCSTFLPQVLGPWLVVKGVDPARWAEQSRTAHA